MTKDQKYLRVKQYSISPDFFEKGFPLGGGPCTCTSTCCEGGVYADIMERDKIIENKEIIKKYMDETQTTVECEWFEIFDSEDNDFASGHCVGTREVNNKCAFLDKLGRCSLQVAAIGEGLHKWTWKPLYCILFPVEISNMVIGFDQLLQGEQPCCSADRDFQVPLFEACREELVHLVGEDGYETIEKHYATLRQLALAVDSKDSR